MSGPTGDKGRESGTSRAAAQEYLALGYSVIPTKHETKLPALRSWKRFQDAPPNAIEVDQWWPEDDPDRNGIAIVTGRVSGLCVLDVDPRNGGEESLQQLLAQGFEFPPTLRVDTGRGDGGHHLYYSAPQESSRQLGPGLDFKGEGGYVIAPPTLHRVGGRYRFSNVAEPAALPEWLRTLVNAASQPPSTPGGGLAHAARAAGTIVEGTRNTTLTSLGGAMRARGCELPQIHEALHEANQARCQPPLDTSEVDGIARSVAGYAKGHAWNGPDPEWLARVVHAVLQDVRRRLYTSNVMRWVLEVAWYGEDAFPSLLTLADGERSRRTVSRHLNEARKAGRLEILGRHRPNGSFTTNSYRILL